MEAPLRAEMRRPTGAAGGLRVCGLLFFSSETRRGQTQHLWNVTALRDPSTREDGLSSTVEAASACW